MILYLGLDPSRYVSEKPLLHHPLILTKKLASPKLAEALQKWPDYTHAIFTSRAAVRYWFEEAPVGTHEVLAVGDGTALALRALGIEPRVAKEATQEGIIALLDTLEEARIFWPRSDLARDVLGKYLEKREFDHFIFDLYTVEFNSLPKIEDWSGIEEIVFTSPSTVVAFCRLYGFVPRGVKCRAIGPVTEKKLQSLLRCL